jgi:hypothetical protein
MEVRDTYLIIIEGHISKKRAGLFEGMELVPLKDGSTLLRGNVYDQAGLYSVLNQIMNLGLKLISVERQRIKE